MTYMRLKRKREPWHAVDERYVTCGVHMVTSACGLCVREIACEFTEDCEQVWEGCEECEECEEGRE
jgi:hypothetical protein